MKFYPEVQQLLSDVKESPFNLHRSPRSMLGLFSLALFLALIILLISFLSSSLNEEGAFSFYWLLIVPAVICAEAFRRFHDDLYIIEADRITHKGGRLSLQYNVPAVRYRDIRAVSVIQSFAGRIFDYGTVELNTAAQDEGELSIAGIRSPDELAHLIETMRKEIHSESSTNITSE